MAQYNRINQMVVRLPLPDRRHQEEADMNAPNQSMERLAAGGRRSRIRESWAAAIAHFFRSTINSCCP
ncbi:MAG: hypothetical protein RIQ71_1842 [Verrucomicrobiota bacterium]|jgi:hypothetical protein